MRPHHLPVWWNWQTRRTQNPVVAIPCRFDPDYRHQKKPKLNRKGQFGFLFIQAAGLAYHPTQVGISSRAACHPCISSFLRLDDIQHLVLVVYSFCEIDNIQGLILEERKALSDIFCARQCFFALNANKHLLIFRISRNNRAEGYRASSDARG